MKNPIDPRQYTPYALNTPSGNLYFVENTDNFECYLLEEVTGNFHFIGDLTVNTGKVLYTDSSNNVDSSNNNAVLNSTDALGTGSNNLIANSNLSEISGTRNTIVGGRNNQIADADDAGILFGSQCVIQYHTGAVLIGDGDNSRGKQSVTHNSLTVDFASGAFFENDVFVNGDFYSTGDIAIFDCDLNISSVNSGTASGDFQFLSNVYQTGSPLQNLQNLRDASGDLLAINTGASGLAHDELVATSGVLATSTKSTGDYLIDNALLKLSHQTIAGPKFFEAITGKIVNIGATGKTVPSTYNDPGASGTVVVDGEYLYCATGEGAWGRVQFSAW